MHIEKVNLSEELRKQVVEGFAKHSTESVGWNGGISPLSLVASQSDEIIGVLDSKFFWGALHIRWLFVFPPYRGQGVGKKLIEKLITCAREESCPIIFVETLDFQALSFYIKFGFTVEFFRSGYTNNRIFYYLKKVVL